jgi:Calx-beta domain
MTWNQKTAITLIVFALGVPLAKEAAAAPPSNDSFANAANLSPAAGSPATANATNVEATLEPGEPANPAGPGSSSVWFKWQADQTETVAIDTCGSDFNTILAVYTGNQLNTLSLKASNDEGGNCGGKVVLGVTAGQSYRISVDGYHGAKGNIDLNITDSPPVVSIEREAKVTEQDSGTSLADLDVTISEPLGSPVTAKVESFEDSALIGEDFTDIDETVTFAPGATTASVTVPVIGDTDPELDERFIAFLHTVQGGGAQPYNQHAEGTILNDDGPPPSASIDDVQVTEGDSGPTAVDFTVTLANPVAGKSAKVGYGTHDGSASYGGDYDWKEGALNFAPGETEEHVTVPVNGDEYYEPNEQFTMNLSAGPYSGATVDKGVGTATILDDDQKPALSIAPASASEGARELIFTVSLTGDRPEGGLGLQYRTVDGPLAKGEPWLFREFDFLATDGYFGFDPGEQTQTVEVPLWDDGLDEPNEDFQLHVTSSHPAVDAVLGTGTIVDDDEPAGGGGGGAGGGNENGGDTPCVVPRLKGKRLRRARTALTKSGCAIGEVRRKKSKRRKVGRVLRQGRAAGVVLPAGTRVNVVVGKRRAAR